VDTVDRGEVDRVDKVDAVDSVDTVDIRALSVDVVDRVDLSIPRAGCHGCPPESPRWTPIFLPVHGIMAVDMSRVAASYSLALTRVPLRPDTPFSPVGPTMPPHTAFRCVICVMEVTQITRKVPAQQVTAGVTPAP
jgi:hypothetical protein